MAMNGRGPITPWSWGQKNESRPMTYPTYPSVTGACQADHAEENSEDEVAERLWRRVEEVKQHESRGWVNGPPFKTSKNTWWSHLLGEGHTQGILTCWIFFGSVFFFQQITVLGCSARYLVSKWIKSPLYVLGSKLPLFPYNRGWSSTQ